MGEIRKQPIILWPKVNHALKVSCTSIGILCDYPQNTQHLPYPILLCQVIHLLVSLEVHTRDR